MNRHVALAAVLGVVSHASAQGSLTTTFAGGFTSGGVFFNLSTTRPGGIWLRRVQAQVTAPVGVNNCGSLFWREGGYGGHTTSAAGWQQSFMYPPCQTVSAGVPMQWGINGINLYIPSGVTIGLLLRVDGNNPAGRLAWTSIPPAAGSYTNGELTLAGGEAVNGAFSAPTIPGAMINITLSYSHTGPSCYANCVGDDFPPPWLNVMDFTCFINLYGAGNSYANCDRSTSPPILNVSDFVCFMNAFSAGCTEP